MRYWGCEAHWLMLPGILRTKFIKTQLVQAGGVVPVQPVAHQMAIEDIRNWVERDAVADGVVSSTSTEELEARFCAGLTTEGQLLLFWPLAGEYLLLGPAEAAILKRVLRVV